MKSAEKVRKRTARSWPNAGRQADGTGRSIKRRGVPRRVNALQIPTKFRDWGGADVVR